jgi:hypothetical protein
MTHVMSNLPLKGFLGVIGSFKDRDNPLKDGRCTFEHLSK